MNEWRRELGVIEAKFFGGEKGLCWRRCKGRNSFCPNSFVIGRGRHSTAESHGPAGAGGAWCQQPALKAGVGRSTVLAGTSLPSDCILIWARPCQADVSVVLNKNGAGTPQHKQTFPFRLAGVTRTSQRPEATFPALQGWCRCPDSWHALLWSSERGWSWSSVPRGT